MTERNTPPKGGSMDEIRYVADRIALMDVMLRYAKGCDQRDLDLYASVFAEDVEIIGFTDEVVRGRDNWVPWVRERLEDFDATQHMMAPQLATIDGDHAHCRTDVQALHYLKGAPNNRTLTLWATYNTDMKRIDGAWKIVRHELERRGVRIQED